MELPKYYTPPAELLEGRGFRHVSEVKIEGADVILSALLTYFARATEFGRKTPIIGKEHLQDAVERLMKGETIICVFLPHTNTFDPLMLNLQILHPYIVKEVKKRHKELGWSADFRFAWPAAAKFAFKILCMRQMKRIEELVIAGVFKQLEILPFFFVQQRVLDEEIYDSLKNLGSLGDTVVEEAERVTSLYGRMLIKALREKEPFLLAYSPEATRNQDGGLRLPDSDLLPNAFKLKPRIKVLTVILHEVANLRKRTMFTKIPMEILPLISEQELRYICEILEWKKLPEGKKDKEVRLVDAVMYRGAQRLSKKDIIVPGVDPMGAYGKEHISINWDKIALP